MTSFMAECFWPGVTRLLLEDAGRRAGDAAQGFGSKGALTRYVGAILVPADEIALCMFEAPSIDAATELNERAAIPFERILEVVRLDPAITGPTRRATADQNRKDTP